MSAAALLFDDMFSGTIAARLRDRGLDAVAVVESRALLSTPDEDLLSHAAEQQRVLVTSNIGDFAGIAQDWRAAERTHHGIVYVANRTFPRDRSFIGAVVVAIVRLYAAQALPAPGVEIYLTRRG